MLDDPCRSAVRKFVFSDNPRGERMVIEKMTGTKLSSKCEISDFFSLPARMLQIGAQYLYELYK